VRQTSYPSTASVSLSGHIARLDDSADAKEILTTQQIGRDHPLPSDHMDVNSPESYNLTLTEAVSVAQNRPLWRLLAESGATHCQR